ncbi:MAG: RNA polymerase sporulation sigma factor SigK [Clostridiales bacterium]|jgi:RNA polymerase sporulation-specific sigma factor|nr:RNA polymerase sporulation sigma factor SigK [Clostridiales bacterium]
MFTFIQFVKDLLFFAAYVNTSTSFPEPLSKPDESKYIALCIAGDEEARQKLIEHNLRLVAHIAKKFAKNSNDTEDMISIGIIGLIKAVSTFKPDRGTLAAYAAKCIENEIFMDMRKNSKYSSTFVRSLDEPIGHDNDGNEITIADKYIAEQPDLQEEINRDMLNEKLRGGSSSVLSETERMVLTTRYNLDGKKALPQREVAVLLGVSRSYVSRIEKRALNKLRHHFGEDDFAKWE